MTDPTNILSDCATTYEAKNDDYGDSWRLVGEFLWMLSNDGIELNSKEDFISFGLYTRRLDKLARAFNGEFNDDDLNFESVMDSHEDEATYAAMHASNQSDRQDEKTSASDEILPEPDGDEQISVISEDADNYDSVLEALRENAAKDQRGSR
jgi:hypothetical protein